VGHHTSEFKHRNFSTSPKEPFISSSWASADLPRGRRKRRIWRLVSHSPLESLWNLQGVPLRVVMRRTWRSIIEDRILGHAAELGFYFLFALFPTLFSAASILGLAARSAVAFYQRLLDYLALVIPTEALGAVLSTFNETTAAASSGKVTFGLIAAIWSASVGISAIQDTLNGVYKIEDCRSYFVARIHAIGTVGLAALLGGDYLARQSYIHIHDQPSALAAAISARVICWIIASCMLTLAFAVIYYWAPDCHTRRWHWLTPGGAVGIVGWLLASVGFRIYLHFFTGFTMTYGSLGAVVILLTWFYITGLMLLVGAEINSQIEAAAAEMRLGAGEENRST
jgi:membrane protein